MEKGKTGKYFKYAIGEIILVVIGILIALQINNWNEARIAKKNEIILVQQLLEDAKTDSQFFNDRVKSLKGQKRFYNELFQFCNNEISEDEIRKELDSSLFHQPFIQLIYQSNLITNNPEASVELDNNILKQSLRNYISKHKYVATSLENHNSRIENDFAKFRIRYHQIIPNTYKAKSVIDYSFLCDSDTGIGLVKFINSKNSDGIKNLTNFLEANEELIIKLKSYLGKYND
ncbi:DUF6090 family protein [Winogradskyella maritima]|uniref:DUF6090 family protein n=1 Tax=Winogradskyella maritima TaxID=1517766 RepID=A0ABV8AHR7_9FLAO|nr:DUF6090 family protein [Winogradskyella maritima]